GLGDAAGGLTLNGGALAALGSFSSARAVTLGVDGGAIDTMGNTLTFKTPLSGPGGLAKLGAGTLVLSGANSHAGGTMVDDGTLQLAPGASLPVAGALVVNGGTVDFNSNNVSLGSLSGAGGTLSLGSGTMT